MAERVTDASEYLSKTWLAEHLREERREADLLSEVREAIFGAQDGVTSILTVVITVATATSNQYAVLVAGGWIFGSLLPHALGFAGIGG